MTRKSWSSNLIYRRSIKAIFLSSTLLSLLLQASCTRDDFFAAVATLAVDLQATVEPLGSTIQVNAVAHESQITAVINHEESDSVQSATIPTVITLSPFSEPAPSSTPHFIPDTPTPLSTETSTSTPEPSPTPTTIPTATPMPLEYPVIGGMMYFVPGGFFEMGADGADLLAECTAFMEGCQEEWFAASEPLHMVLIAPYYLDIHEVTNEAYVTFLNDISAADGSCRGQPCLDEQESEISYEEDSYYVAAEYSRHPATGVTWYGADAYCEWRSARLPTEAEWEKAAGWDDRTGNKSRYPWGDIFDGERVNFCDVNCDAPQANSDFDDGQPTSAPIMSYEGGRSPSGGYDLAGNVWEWVSDWFDAEFFTEEIFTNPIGPDKGEAKVVRGGSWFDTGNFMATTIRFPSSPDNADKTIGFRCAADLSRP
jgi:formylglycine-generating enzyme required for sulfatase activity